MLYNTMIPSTGYYWICKWKEYSYDTKKWEDGIDIPFKPFENLSNKQVQDLSAWKNGSKERKIKVLADYKFKINDLIMVTFGDDEIRYKITGVEYEEDIELFTPAQLGLYNSAKNSIAIDNEIPATGGKGGDTIEEIRQNALATFGSQNRAVTKQDYIVRALSMPERYGGVAKVYVSPDGELDNNSPASIYVL